MSRGQIALRFIHIPADRSSTISERSTKVENIRLSCDAAYFIPALLRDGPNGFNHANNWNMILPFPTFNECQKDNVPLFFFKRSESRDKQENLRAKVLLDVFSDKLSKRQNTFYGDVLVFWRRNVDETRHQMKLSDFTLADIYRLLGTKANPVEDGPNGEETYEVGSRRDSSAASKTTDDNPSYSETKQNGTSNSPMPESHRDEPSVSEVTHHLLPEIESKALSTGSSYVVESLDHQQKSDVVLSSTPILTTQQEDLFFSNPIGSDPTPLGSSSSSTSVAMRLNTTDTPSTILVEFFEFLTQHLPIAMTASDALISEHRTASALNGTDEQRLIDSGDIMIDPESRELRLQSEMMKMATELSQLTALNNTLSRKYQTAQQELSVVQSQAQSFREDAKGLVREIGILRDEMLILRERNQALEAELRAGSRLGVVDHSSATTGLGSLTASPSNTATLPGGRRPLHHVKSSGGHTINPITGSPNLCDSTTRLEVISKAGGVPNSSPSTGWRDIHVSMSGRQFIVAQVYTPAEGAVQEQFASLTEGEIVTVDREDDSGWWWVTNGRPLGSGWYPFSFLKPVSQQQ